MAKTNAEAENSNKATTTAAAARIRAHRRRRSSQPESTSAIMERLLASPVSITMNNKTTQVSADQAIILQLLQKGMSGSIRARRALMKYEEYAHRFSEKALEVTFVDSDYTTTFANLVERDENG